MPYSPPQLNLSQLKVHPLTSRKSLTRAEDILVDPESPPPACSDHQLKLIELAAESIQRAVEAKASILLFYGAHLLRNGAALVLNRMMEEGWITHLATNGAGTIHDWEYAYLGQSTESVRENVATGTFGAWDETGRFIHLALMAGGVEGLGYGCSLGRFIAVDGCRLPSKQTLRSLIEKDPAHLLTGARSELLAVMADLELEEGLFKLEHRWKRASILASAYHNKIALTVHPGIGYDIISNHPWFNGAAIGRAAMWDFRALCHSVDGLDNGVVLSVGSAIMGPQVFEKSLSCVHNLRFQNNRSPVQGHGVYVVDLQDGGQWDWTQGEPPKDHPAYYLRFCKSYSRMGGRMQYVQCDNMAFIHRLYSILKTKGV